MMDHSDAEPLDTVDWTPYATPLTSPSSSSSSSGYESCFSILEDFSNYDLDPDVDQLKKSGKFCGDGGQEFAENIDEKIEEWACDICMVPPAPEVWTNETVPKVSPGITQKDSASEGLMAADVPTRPLKDSDMELLYSIFPNSEKKDDLHEYTRNCKQCKFLLRDHDTVINLDRGIGTYPLDTTIPESGGSEYLPAEKKSLEQQKDFCCENGDLSFAEDIGANSHLEKFIATSHLSEDRAEAPPSKVSGNEAIKPLPDEIERGEESSDIGSLNRCTTVFENCEGIAAKNDTKLPIEYLGTDIKSIEAFSTEVGIDIPPEDDTTPPGVISTKCCIQPSDNLRMNNFISNLPEKGSQASCLQVVSTEPPSMHICEIKDGSSSSVSTEILVEHIDDISLESTCNNTDMTLLPHDVGEKKSKIEENSLLSSGSTDIPVLDIRNGLPDGTCAEIGTAVPQEVVSTKYAGTKEDTRPKLASTAADNTEEDPAVLTLPTKPMEYILPEPLISNFGTDPDMWTPPELTENEAHLPSESDEEDESRYEDESGMNLLQSKIDDEVNEKAMVEVMNAEFKRLLKRFMVAEGFSVPDEAGDEGPADSWLRIVRVLSWQAALLIKPDLVAGKEMDPSLYVKVKCIASGSRIQSEVIDGLVFKKSAAHKHMPTCIRNPKLLLVHDVLDHSVSGLSSIHSMEHDKDVLYKSIKMVLDKCQPNIILVEKAASREAQELVRMQGITLVLDMKLHRMERIMRCTGSKVVSLGDALTMPDVVKECGNFRIEKFVEDINSEGKKSSKNLMFLEGLPKPLGCTILLRGANIEELKRIKRVLNYAVFAAHHLVRVTSFLSDQRLLASCKDALRKQNSLFVSPEPEPMSPSRSLASNSSTDCSTLSQDLEIPISDEELPLALSDMPLRTDSTSPELVPSEILNGRIESDETEIVKNGEIRIVADPEKEREDVKDPHSALIIVSCRNIVKRTICEERHLSRINYYGDSDTTLGTQLRDVFLNEKHRCSVCGDAPEAHLYVYTQRSGRITVLVTSLPPKLDLSHRTSKNLDKIWMWTRCWRCNKENRPSGPSARFTVSDSARSISFVKFLELSFSRYLPGTKLPCGHLIYHDGLRFFGMGSKVAMLRYTPVEIYEACKPPAMLEFHDPNCLDWLQKEAQTVNEKHVLLFSEVRHIAEELKQRYTNDTASLGVIESVLLMGEETEAQVEVSLPWSLDSANKINKKPVLAVQDILSLNWLYQILLLVTYVWDCRLSHLFRSLPPKQEKDATGSCKLEEKLDGNFGNSDGACSKSSDEPPSSSETCLQIVPIAEDSALETTLSDTEQAPDPDGLHSILTLDVTHSKMQDKDAWIWVPFSSLLMSYRKELQAGFLERFNEINRYVPCHLPRIQNQRESEPERKFIVGPGGNVLTVCEDEISSLIAYSLCISEENRENKVDSAIPEIDTSHSSNAMSLSPEEFLLVSKHLHPEFSIGKGDSLALKGKYTITCVYAEQFYNLRKKCCPSEIMYISSLSRCKRWNAQGGKTKAFFSKTMDDRFIIKGIKKIEFDSFLQFAPYYFNYMSESIEKGNQTCLTKILGIYQIVEVRNGKETRMDLMVMENLLYGRHLSRTYDLKGAIFARRVAGSDSCTFLDQNFIEDMRECPIYLSQRTKKLFERAIWNDTSFLTSINVMDYSLLLGVDRENRAIVFGIIDYLRQYTWDKQLETWVKSSLVVPKNELPTVISPKEYKKRFRKFMQQYVLTVPDGWGSEMVNSPWVVS